MVLGIGDFDLSLEGSYSLRRCGRSDSVSGPHQQNERERDEDLQAEVHHLQE